MGEWSKESSSIRHTHATLRSLRYSSRPTVYLKIEQGTNRSLCVCEYICKYMYANLYIHLHRYMYIYIDICICIYIYIERERGGGGRSGTALEIAVSRA